MKNAIDFMKNDDVRHFYRKPRVHIIFPLRMNFKIDLIETLDQAQFVCQKCGTKRRSFDLEFKGRMGATMHILGQKNTS